MADTKRPLPVTRSDFLADVIRIMRECTEGTNIRKGDEVKIQLNLITQALTRLIFRDMVESVHNAKKETFVESMARKAIVKIAGLKFSEIILAEVDRIAFQYEDNKSVKTNHVDGEDYKRIALTTQLGIGISPTHVRKYLRVSNIAGRKREKNEGNREIRVSKVSANVIAIFLDVVLRRTLKAAVAVITATNKSTMQPRHILLGVYSDELLSDFYGRNNIYILGGGVVPYLSPLLDEDDKKKKQKQRRRAKARKEAKDQRLASGETAEPPRRRLPAAISKGKIRRAQEDTNLIIQAAPFKLLVKTMLGNDKYRVSPDAVNALQNYSETRIIKLMREVLRYTEVTRNTVSLNPSLLLEIAVQRGIINRDGESGQILLPELTQHPNKGSGKQFFKLASVIRLATRAGWARTRKNVPTDTNPNPNGPTLVHTVGVIMESVIRELITVAIKDMAIRKQTKLSASYVSDAAFSLGTILPAHIMKRKTTKKVDI